MSEPTAIRLELRVVPNGSRSEVVGWHDGALKVKVQAPPEGGRANREVIALLSKELGLGKRDVTIEKGETARNKIVAVTGLSQEALYAKLGQPS